MIYNNALAGINDMILIFTSTSNYHHFEDVLDSDAFILKGRGKGSERGSHSWVLVNTEKLLFSVHKEIYLSSWF